MHGKKVMTGLKDDLSKLEGVRKNKIISLMVIYLILEFYASYANEEKRKV